MKKKKKMILFVFTCWPGRPSVIVETVHFIGLSDVQLVAFRDFLEVCALVECTAETGLPHGGVGFIPPLPVFTFVHSPGLDVKK